MPGWELLFALAASGEPAALPPVVVKATPSVVDASQAQSPASVSTVGAAAIHDAQLQVDLSESLSRVPGLVVGNRHNFAQDVQLSMRGFGARTPFGVRGIRLYTDGIPATMPDGQGQVSHFDLAGADSVTVLRGPFSALYGASSGGVIELNSREPQRNALSATAWRAPDATQRYLASGEAAGARWGGTGDASWLDTQGFREHSAATRTGAQARVSGGSSRELAALANIVDIDAQDPLGLTRAQFDADPRQAGANALAYNTRKTVRQEQAGLAWTPALGDAQALRAVTWLGQRRTRQFQAIPDTVQGTAASNPGHPGGVIDLDRLYYGADLRWISRAVTLGLDIENLGEHRQGFQNYIGTPGPGSTKGVEGPLRRDEDNTARSIDPYAQLQWLPARDVALFAGVRHTTTRIASADHFVIAGNGDDSGSVTYEAWLPAAGLRQAAGPWNWHVAASQGAELPTLNELAYRPDGTAGLNTALEPSRSRNAEAGLEWRAEDMNAGLTAFTVRTRNEIVVAASSGGRTTYQNASSTRRDGLEASAQAPLGHGLQATLAYTLLDARYGEDFASGHALPGVPRNSAFAELAWRGAWGLVALEGLYRDALSVNDAATDAANAYTVMNVRVAAPLPGGFELMARLDNLLDAVYAGSVIVNEANGRYFEPAPGRGVSAGLRWTSR